MIMGREFTGMVTAVGEGVQDRRWANGSWCSR
jgi:D-arabinose 1-dehydrogenase-like Zn-dependent alcohol dehydrogenase